jgi:hypothetical protein
MNPGESKIESQNKTQDRILFQKWLFKSELMSESIYEELWQAIW